MGVSCARAACLRKQESEKGKWQQPSIQFPDGPPAQREPRCGGTPPNRHRSARSGPFHRRSDGQGRLRRQVGRAYSYVAVDDDEAGARGGTTRSAAGWRGAVWSFGRERGKKSGLCSAEREREGTGRGRCVVRVRTMLAKIWRCINGREIQGARLGNKAE